MAEHQRPSVAGRALAKRDATRGRARWCSTSLEGWLFVAALALGGCSAPSSLESDAAQRQALTGAVESGRGEFPHVVSLGGCSGTLVHPRLVLYAAHCGEAIGEVRFGTDADRPERVVTTEWCQAHPRARLGDGTDLAFCVLSEAVTDVVPARLLAGCERDQVREGAAVTLVGFGLAAEGGSYGTQRWGSARVQRLGPDMVLDGGVTDTCLGDSGGPAFVPVQVSPGLSEPRLLAVTSAGTSRDCGRGESHYVDAGRQLAWLETASNLDLSPCFDTETWAPTPACTQLTSPSVRLSTCGANPGGPPDSTPPSVTFVAPLGPSATHQLEPGRDYFETSILTSATDVDGGVRDVTFSLFDANGQRLLLRVDELAPFELERLRLPPGNYALVAEAHNFAGSGVSQQLRFQILAPPDRRATAGHCGFRPATPPAATGTAWLLLALLARQARRVRHAKSLSGAGGATR